MSIGPDLKEVFEEVGPNYQVIEGTGDGEDSYMAVELNAQVTKPFIREYFLECSMPYDSDAAVGDIVTIVVPDMNYMVMNMTPEMFENEVVKYSSVLYKCNFSGEIQRPTEVRSDQTLQMTQRWDTQVSTAYGLMTEALYGHDLETDEEIGNLGLEQHEFYVPARYGIQVNDRVVIVSGEEYYRVETKKKRRYSAVDVVTLGEDNR